MRGPVRAGIGAALLLAAFAACRPEPEPPVVEDDPLEGVLPERDADPVRQDPVEPHVAETPVPAEILHVAADTVVGWAGPGGRPFLVARRTAPGDAHLSRRIGRMTFALPAREEARTLVQYPCTSCHEGVTVMADRVPDAHGDIQPEHPTLTGGACATCHRPESVERLGLPGGESASLDHAYRLCAQCHFSETNDWAAGAHGKRLVGWHGPRVVMGCADCHDPHRPGLEPRLPFRGPTLPRAAGRTP